MYWYLNPLLAGNQDYVPSIGTNDCITSTTDEILDEAKTSHRKNAAIVHSYSFAVNYTNRYAEGHKMYKQPD